MYINRRRFASDVRTASLNNSGMRNDYVRVTESTAELSAYRRVYEPLKLTSLVDDVAHVGFLQHRDKRHQPERFYFSLPSSAAYSILLRDRTHAAQRSRMFLTYEIILLLSASPLPVQTPQKYNFFRFQ